MQKNFELRTPVYCIVKFKKQILLLHRTEDVDVWEAPGGKIRYGESPKNAALRELKEETGLKIKDAKLFSVGSTTYSNIMQIPIFYLVEMKIKPEIKIKEHVAYRWFSLNDIKKLKNLALSVSCIMSDLKDIV